MEKKQIEVLENGNVRVTIPLIFKIAGGRTRIFTTDSEHVEYTPTQLALARAFRWQKMIDEGKFSVEATTSSDDLSYFLSVLLRSC